MWAEEYSRWRDARLDKDRWVYVWVDGIYSGLRAEQAKRAYEESQDYVRSNPTTTILGAFALGVLLLLLTNATDKAMK